MENLLNKIHNCKNQKILPLLPDKSVQVFLEDAPYGITACKWDIMSDLKEYWDLRLPKLKDNGCFVLFGSEPFSSYLRMSNIKMYKYDWIWEKERGTGFANANKQPLNNYEIISIFYKNMCVYKPKKIKLNKPYLHKLPTKNSKSNTFACVNTNKKNEYRMYTESYPKRIIKYKRVYNKNMLHPTQKPLELIKYLILTYSNEGDLIFDGYSGSGTIACGCTELNRNFICCEDDTKEGYFEKSILRLENIKKNLKQFLF